MLQNVGDITNIKLIDFGLSKDIQQRGMIKSLCSGSPFYIAPEVISCRLSLACDMWSLGIVMYVALSGKLPFPGESTQEIFENVIQKELDIENDMDMSNVSPEAKHLLSLILNKNPKKRITPVAALQHPWFRLFEEGGRLYRDKEYEMYRHEGLQGAFKA